MRQKEMEAADLHFRSPHLLVVRNKAEPPSPRCARLAPNSCALDAELDTEQNQREYDGSNRAGDGNNRQRALVDYVQLTLFLRHFLLNIIKIDQSCLLECVRAEHHAHEPKACGRCQKVIAHAPVRSCLHLKEQKNGGKEGAQQELQHGSLREDHEPNHDKAPQHLRS